MQDNISGQVALNSLVPKSSELRDKCSPPLLLLPGLVMLDVDFLTTISSFHFMLHELRLGLRRQDHMYKASRSHARVLACTTSTGCSTGCSTCVSCADSVTARLLA